MNIINFCKKRLNRIKYVGLTSLWLGITWAAVTTTIYSICSIHLSGFLLSQAGRSNVFLLLNILEIFILIIFLVLTVKRLHDINLSGWWVLLCAVPVLGQLWNLAIYFIPGTVGNNNFGTQPANASKLDYLFILTFPVAIILSLILLFIMGPHMDTARLALS